MPEQPVTLREVAVDDIDVFFEHQADSAASHMAAFPSRNRDDHRAHWEKIMSDEAVTTRTVLWNGEVAGNIVGFSQEGKREVGYWIGKDYWGRGVATAAVSQFLELADERPLYAYVASHNIASIRVLEKCGFDKADRVMDAGVEFVVMMLEH